MLWCCSGGGHQGVAGAGVELHGVHGAPLHHGGHRAAVRSVPAVFREAESAAGDGRARVDRRAGCHHGARGEGAV